MEEELQFSTIVPAENPRVLRDVRTLLATHGLELDPGLEVMALAWQDDRLVACAGLDHTIVKCVAISSDMQGENLTAKLIGEVTNLATERGHHHLFLFTKPENRAVFEASGFYFIAEVPGQAVLMENTPLGISRYVKTLEQRRRPGDVIGGIVLNANPFTVGHRHLVETAAKECDFLHVFVVAEDSSYFPYVERLDLVRQGVAALKVADKIRVHPGSQYMVSRATFPTYFLKEEKTVSQVRTGMDLVIFRTYIAPALGITRRFVGTEPFCKVTSVYNDEMKHWLTTPEVPAPPLQVIEVPRLEIGGRAVSATEVRRHIKEGNLDALVGIVPASTMNHLRARYASVRRPRPQPSAS